MRSEDRRGELLRGAKLNVDAKRQRNELNNLANRVTTIDANGVGQSNDLAKPVHALSMKLFRTYAGEDPCNGGGGPRLLQQPDTYVTQTGQCPVNLCPNCIRVHGWNRQPPRALHKLETRRRETGPIVKGDGNAFITAPLTISSFNLLYATN